MSHDIIEPYGPGPLPALSRKEVEDYAKRVRSTIEQIERELAKAVEEHLTKLADQTGLVAGTITFDLSHEQYAERDITTRRDTVRLLVRSRCRLHAYVPGPHSNLIDVLPDGPNVRP